MRGTIATIESNAVVIDLHGFRVRVSTSTRVLAGLGGINDPIELVTHLVVREDALALYGFVDAGDLDLFLLLLGVTGVGPRVALNVLSFGDQSMVLDAIANGDAKLLAKIPGIGQRTAERIVLDLRGKLPEGVAAGTSPRDEPDRDAIEALEALGYTSIEARNALSAVQHRSGMTVEERVFAALQRLSQS
ncbi:MAG TPA: Holliday junction branch migration protein RuvA [Thermomicrobiales bacterium]|nr:Holliday junction branch migration protein RuvA [Thermomicrobiales bacterium]